MPEFEVTQYEVWATKYRVTAASAGEAALKVYHSDECESVDGSMEPVCSADEYGISEDEDFRICRDFIAAGGQLDDERIPSIVRVEEI